nr:hypothetical protein [Tanacetum cinerariifolium]
SFLEVKNASTPMETQKVLPKDEDGKKVDVHMYRSMIGSLTYLTSLRPDIMFAVCACARYQVNPKVLHLHAVKRIFRYLKGLGYNVVPSPYTRNFLPPKPDLFGLEEFVNEPIVTEPRVTEPIVKKPAVETNEAKASADKPKVVRKNFGSLLIEDWISNSKDEAESKPKIEKKIVKPSFAKTEFVKSKEQVKSSRKTTVKQVEKPWQNTHKPRGNQRN